MPSGAVAGGVAGALARRAKKKAPSAYDIRERVPALPGTNADAVNADYMRHQADAQAKFNHLQQDRLFNSIQPAATTDPTAPATPTVPSVEDYLSSDPGYLTDVGNLDSSFNNFLAQLTQQRNDYEQQYGVATHNLGNARSRDKIDLAENYASRGLLRSGIYGNSLGELVQNYDQQQNSLDMGRTNTLRDFNNDQQNTTLENTQAHGSAREKAIARRAAQYGIS